MIDDKQNSQVETATKLALQGGEYAWSRFPIGEAVGMNIPCGNSAKEVRDMALLRRAQRVSSGMLASDLEFPETAGGKNGFVVVHPLEELRAACLRAEAGRNQLVEGKLVTAASYKDVAPKNALAVREFLALLDRAVKKEKKRPASSAVSADAEQQELLKILKQGLSAAQRESSTSSRRSTSMRSATMDASASVSVESLLPAGSESIKNWFSWLARRLNQFTKGYQDIRLFLFHNAGKTLYRDLPAEEKTELRGIVTGIVARDEA